MGIHFQDIKSQFQLDPAVTYLNHGSFGACPLQIFENYQYWQKLLEQQPVKFMTETGPAQIEISKKALADFITCDKDDLVFTPNPTYAINIIAKSLKLNPGDEILSTDQEYGAMDKTWNYYCKHSGAIYKRFHISLPVSNHDEFADKLLSQVTSQTKVIFISHITSPTALIFPVEKICQKAREMGIITIVDGAHAPGHIPVDITKMNPDVYTGACHKWMLTPKGSSFLYVKRTLQSTIDPLVISWGYDSDHPGKSQFLDYHTQQGTRDYSAFLTIPAAIEFRQKFNWNEVSMQCRKLVKQSLPIFSELLGSPPLSPTNDEWLGQMFSLRIHTKDSVLLKSKLLDNFNIEVPVMSYHGNNYIRISIQGYNDQSDLDNLVSAIEKLTVSGDLTVGDHKDHYIV